MFEGNRASTRSTVTVKALPRFMLCSSMVEVTTASKQDALSDLCAKISTMHASTA